MKEGSLTVETVFILVAGYLHNGDSAEAEWYLSCKRTEIESVW